MENDPIMGFFDFDIMDHLTTIDCLKSQFLQRIYNEKLEVLNEATNHSMIVM